MSRKLLLVKSMGILKDLKAAPFFLELAVWSRKVRMFLHGSQIAVSQLSTPEVVILQ